jgi:hypothetical protein
MKNIGFFPFTVGAVAAVVSVWYSSGVVVGFRSVVAVDTINVVFPILCSAVFCLTLIVASLVLLIEFFTILYLNVV